MAKVKVFERPDGHIEVFHFNLRLKNPGESDDDFINRVMSKLKRDRPDYLTYTEHDKDSDDVPNDRKDRDKWRLKPSGKVEVDNSIETDKEKKDKSRKDAKTKLKALGLTDEEVDVLTGAG